MQPPPKKLLAQVRDAIWLKPYAYRTEQTYVQWICRHILFHDKPQPQEMSAEAIWLDWSRLAIDRHIAASTQIEPSGPTSSQAGLFTIRSPSVTAGT